MIISILHTNKYAQENKKEEEEFGWVSIRFESSLIKGTVPLIWKISLWIDVQFYKYHSRWFCLEIIQVHVVNEQDLNHWNQWIIFVCCNHYKQSEVHHHRPPHSRQEFLSLIELKDENKTLTRTNEWWERQTCFYLLEFISKMLIFSS